MLVKFWMTLPETTKCRSTSFFIIKCPFLQGTPQICLLLVFLSPGDCHTFGDPLLTPYNNKRPVPYSQLVRTMSYIFYDWRNWFNASWYFSLFSYFWFHVCLPSYTLWNLFLQTIETGCSLALYTTFNMSADKPRYIIRENLALWTLPDRTLPFCPLNGFWLNTTFLPS